MDILEDADWIVDNTRECAEPVVDEPSEADKLDWFSRQPQLVILPTNISED